MSVCVHCAVGPSYRVIVTRRHHGCRAPLHNNIVITYVLRTRSLLLTEMYLREQRTPLYARVYDIIYRHNTYYNNIGTITRR